MRNEYYSHSKVKTWRRCHKLYDYKYEQGLVRRTAPAALLRGTTFHEMLDAHVMGTDYKVPLTTYRDIYNNLWEEERAKYPDPDDLEMMYFRYVNKYQDDGLNYNGQSEIEVRAEYKGLVFMGIIDKLPEDRMGRTWIMDHKTHKVIPDENKRFADLQTVLYWWARSVNGFQHSGVMWDYIRTKPPTVPEVLKKGGLTRRKDLDSDYETYLAAIEENGLDPADYQVELDRLKENVFFKRVLLPHPSQELVTNVVEEFFDTAMEIENSTSKARNMNQDCTNCSFFQLCQSEVRGIDGSFIKKQLFTIREEKV